MKFSFVLTLLVGSLLGGISLRGQTIVTPSSPTQTTPLQYLSDPSSATLQYYNNYSYNIQDAAYALSLLSEATSPGGSSAGIVDFTNNSSGSIYLNDGSSSVWTRALNVQAIGADNAAGNGGPAGGVSAFNYATVDVSGQFSNGLSLFSVQSLGGSGTGSDGQGGGTAGAVTVTNAGSLSAGTSSSPIQGAGGFRAIDAFSAGGNAGTGENGYDGSAANNVTVNNTGSISAYWHATNTSGIATVYGVSAISSGGTGGSVGAGADTGKSAGEGGVAGEVTIDQTGNIILVGDLNTSSQLVSGAAILAQSIGGNGGTAGNGDGNDSSYGGNGGISTAGTQITITNSNIEVTGDYLDGVLAQNIGGDGGNGGVNDDHSYAGNGGTAGNMIVNFNGQAGTTYHLSTEGVNAIGIDAGALGGTGGYTNQFTPDAGGVVGNGGNGAGAGWTIVTLQGPLDLSTDGANSVGILAYSVGGNGGNAGALSAIGSSGTAGNGGSGGVAGFVTVSLSDGIAISTSGNESTGIMALSIAGNGGDGGEFKGLLDGDGGNGGDGGNSNNVTVTLDSTSSITTTGNNSSGIVALSFSGAGGAGGAREQGSGSDGAGGVGGSTGTITVANAGDISTQGVSSYGIFALGSSGAGGASGATSSIFYSTTQNGASSGAVGDIDLINSGSIITQGAGSYGIFGMSLSGGGGAGGESESDLTSLGGAGGTAANAGTITLNFTGSTTTYGDLTPAVILQSIGGGGGDGGASEGIVSIGGSGTGGGAGGAVTANLTSGAITTYGEQSLAFLAQSIGGGGGNAGNATSDSVEGSLAIGGSGGSGGNGGAVTVTSGADITTLSTKSDGIVAQSIGGGGGNGGSAYSLNAGLEVSTAVAVGGTGGTGGDGGAVSVTTTGGTIWTGQFATPTTPTNTLPVDAIGILAQSIGGGGGNGGSAWAEAVAIGLPTESGDEFAAAVAYSAGGSGGVAGNGNTVQVTLNGDTQIITQGQGSLGVLAQSIGGGGGNGGDSSAMAATVEYTRVAAKQADATQTYSFSETATLGGTGGAGGNGDAASITLGTTNADKDVVTTYGDYSDALVAQSIGGGGGNAGGGSGTTAGFGASRGGSVSLTLGSDGGAGGSGADADVTLGANGTVVTYGSESLGVVAQSIGGGGGTSQGGMISLSGEFTLQVIQGDNPPQFTSIEPEGSLSLSLGIQGGAGGNGGPASATVDGTVVTYGGDSLGVLVQSIGGGGGLAGSSGADASADNPVVVGGLEDARAFVTEVVEGYVPFSASSTQNIGSYNTGSGGNGDTSTATVDGTIQTQGDWASAVVVQSIGGGGGIGGSADATGSQATMQISMAVGGGNEASGTGGAASVDLGNAKIVTGISGGSSGFSAFGVLVQSIGGGGGVGADGSDSAQGTIDIGRGVVYNADGTELSGIGTVSGSAGDVTLSGSGSITTYGEAAHGVVLQSIGGSGGIGGAGSSVTPGGDTGVTVNLAGSGLYSSGNGGTITATGLDLTIQTFGNNAFGFLAQSIGGGGGLGAVVNPENGIIYANSQPDNNGGSIAIGLVSGASVFTQGVNSYGIFAQSIGGGGGIAGYSSTSTDPELDNFTGGVVNGAGGSVTITVASGASVTTTGNGADGIIAQSIGNGGGVNYLNGTLIFGSATDYAGSGTGGAITINVGGAVQVSGANAYGIFAQSVNGVDDGQAITLTVGGSVTAADTAILIAGGNAQNILTINAGGQVLGTTAVDNSSNSTLTIDNNGVLSGSVLGPFAQPTESLTTINNNGTFFTGPTVAADVTNSGIVEIGNGSKAFNQTEVTGNFTQTATGQLVFNTDFVGVHADFLTIDGNAVLAGKLTPVFTNLLPSVRLPVMQIDGTVTGNLTVGSSPLFNFELTEDNTQTYYLEATTTNFATLSAGLTPNEKAIAMHFDQLWQTASNPLLGKVFASLDSALNTNPNGLGGILNQFSPVNFANFTGSTAFNNTSFVTEQFDDYLANHRGADGTFVSSVGGIDCSDLIVSDPDVDPGLQMVHSRLLAWNPAPSTGLMSDSGDLSLGGTAMQDGKTMTSPEPASPWNVFIAGNAILAQSFSDPSAGLSHSDQTTGAVQVGADYRITSHFLVGAMFGYGHTYATLDNLGSSASVDTYSPGVYASYVDGGWYANALGSYGFSNYSQDRNVSVGALNGTATSSPSGDQIVGNLDGGYDFHRGAWTFGPTTGVQYVHLDVDGFNETGLPGANLNVNETQTDSLRSRLGGHISYALQADDVMFIPHLSASWQHEFLDQSRGVTSQFDGIGGGSFTVQTANPSRDSALVEVGLDAQLDKTWTVFTDYSVQAGQSNYFGQSIQAGVKIGF